MRSAWSVVDGRNVGWGGPRRRRKATVEAASGATVRDVGLAEGEAISVMFLEPAPLSHGGARALPSTTVRGGAGGSQLRLAGNARGRGLVRSAPRASPSWSDVRRPRRPDAAARARAGRRLVPPSGGARGVSPPPTGAEAPLGSENVVGRSRSPPKSARARASCWSCRRWSSRRPCEASAVQGGGRLLADLGSRVAHGDVYEVKAVLTHVDGG